MGADVIAFIEAVKKLPEVADRFDATLIENAITAYNKINGKADDMAYVDAALVEKFNNACSEYNVSVVENKLAHLFDMDMTKYCFELIKDAKASYDALTDAEKANVKNASVLETKLADLKTVWGKDVDFSKTYEENLPTEDPVDPTPDPDPKPDGLKTWVIVLIIVGSVLVAGGAAVAVVLVIRKKKFKF